MPKVFKSEEEKLKANESRLEKQKLASSIYSYELKIKKELAKPHCYKAFRDNFMKLVVGRKNFKDATFFKHLGYCEVEEVFETFEYGAEYCICGHKIKLVALVRYNNPVNNNEYVFNVGSSCILNCEDDKLKSNLENELIELKKKTYTCQHCKRICLSDKNRAENHFNLKEKKCHECSKKSWCRFCKINPVPEPWMSKCKCCWKKSITGVS